MNVNELVEALGKAVDITGIVIIVVGAAVATVAYVRRAVAGWSADASSPIAARWGEPSFSAWSSSWRATSSEPSPSRRRSKAWACWV
jgi:hypothetical protein